jgi:DNA-binding MarR family transcriptional regulator
VFAADACQFAAACRDGDNHAMFEYTEKQGQYLAFIYYYTKINGRPPAEADMQRYFKRTPPTIHQMVLTLEAKGLISRQPGKARSIQILVPPEQLPPLK